MAKQSPLGSALGAAFVELPDEGEGLTQARQSYLDTQRKLQEALESRNQLFDPVLLAMAQGFLAPTKSVKVLAMLLHLLGLQQKASASKTLRLRK
jgi:hypothetical protein